jgi:DNA-binding CsgD family transcriptional regulator
VTEFSGKAAVSRAFDAARRGGPGRAGLVGAAAGFFDALDDDALPGFLAEAARLSWAEALTERYAEAIAHADRAERIVRHTGPDPALPYLSLCRAYAHREFGGLAAGLDAAARAEAAARRLRRTGLAGHALALQAGITALRAGPPAAGRLSDRALRTAGRHSLVAATVATVRLAQGRPGECLDLLGSAVRTSPVALRAMWCCTAARAEAARGDGAAARGWAGRAADAASAAGLAGQQGWAYLAEATCGAGPARYALAVDAFGAGGLVVAEARAGLLLGNALVAGRRLDEAAVAVGRAKRLADASGARHLSALAVDAQRRIGACRPRPAGRVLSTQERRICALVSVGLANRDVARELSVSIKTVEGYLTRIFRKLEVTSRAELAAVSR